ncbi:hypothetical protein [Streptomyces sp. NPDC005125]
MSEYTRAKVAVTGVTGDLGRLIADRMTEQYLAVAGIRHTVLRAGFYASTPAALADENFSPTWSRPLPSTTIPDQSTTPRSLRGR